MAIRVRGLRRKLNVGNKNYAYTLYPDNYGMLDKSNMIEEAALRSGMSKGVMQACWDVAGAWNFLVFLKHRVLWGTRFFVIGFWKVFEKLLCW